jgi:hypothetical protein
MHGEERQQRNLELFSAQLAQDNDALPEARIQGRKFPQICGLMLRRPDEGISVCAQESYALPGIRHWQQAQHARSLSPRLWQRQ